MADEAKRPPTSATAGSDERDLLPPEEEKDVLFQVQMAIANFFLGYYKYGIVLLGIALVAALVVGLIDNARTNSQRKIHAQIASIQKDLTDPEDKEALAKAGTALEKVGAESEGAGAVVAYLQAGEVFRAAEKYPDALRAFEAAHARKGEGILAWAAASGLAAEKVRAGDLEGGIAVYQPYTAGTGIEAEEALWSLAVLQEEAGKKDEARQSLEQLTTRFPETAHLEDASRAMKRLGA